MNIHNEDGSVRFISRMAAQDHIDRTREYLDYVEEHIRNVQAAFVEVCDCCDGMAWVGDDAKWHVLRNEVEHHDISKLSAQEFTQYRDAFYPVDGQEKDAAAFDKAWEHHKANNPHHHETARTEIDVIHMVVDWTAMGYKLGDTAQSYYEANKDNMNLEQWQIELMYEVFDRLVSSREETTR